jgi:hypothetical protein
MLDFMIVNVAKRADEYDDKLKALIAVASASHLRLQHLVNRSKLPNQKLSDEPRVYQIQKGDFPILATATPEHIVLATRLFENLQGFTGEVFELALAANATMRGVCFVREKEPALTLNCAIPLLSATATTFPAYIETLANQSRIWYDKLQAAIKGTTE